VCKIRTPPDELVERHLALVAPIARSFHKRLPTSVDFDDLVGAGNLGLFEAARRFDSANGTSFKSFAAHRIRGAIMDSLRQIDPVSRHLRSQQKAAQRATIELMTILGRTPTEAETAKRLCLSLRRWRTLRRKLHEAGCSVNASPPNGAIGHDEVDRLHGTSPDPEQLTQFEETRSILKGAIAHLPTRSQRVIQLYHFEDCTMKEIAATLGVDASRVSQIRAAALARLEVKRELSVSVRSR
jgi:RNA polymerase sigma factor for flagellar operon FliA